MDNNFLFLCVLQVTLENESIVLYMCEGKVLMDNFILCFFTSFLTISKRKKIFIFIFKLAENSPAVG